MHLKFVDCSRPISFLWVWQAAASSPRRDRHARTKGIPNGSISVEPVKAKEPEIISRNVVVVARSVDMSSSSAKAGELIRRGTILAI